MQVADGCCVVVWLCIHCVVSVLSITQKIHHTLAPSGVASQTSEVFPRLAGSHLTLRNPALEFVKSVCQVLGLDSTTQHQVTKLR